VAILGKKWHELVTDVMKPQTSKKMTCFDEENTLEA